MLNRPLVFLQFSLPRKNEFLEGLYLLELQCPDGLEIPVRGIDARYTRCDVGGLERVFGLDIA